MTLASQLLYSTIVNVSGGPLFLNFVGVTGITLADDEEVTQFGSPFDWVRDGVIGSHIQPRRQQLEDLITTGDIAVLQTPTVVLRDLTTPAQSFMVQADGGSLEIVEIQTGVKSVTPVTYTPVP